MSTEFQIIFTSIMTLLAGLALFVLKSVFKKLEETDTQLDKLQEKIGKDSERIVKLETQFNMCANCRPRRDGE